MSGSVNNYRRVIVYLQVLSGSCEVVNLIKVMILGKLSALCSACLYFTSSVTQSNLYSTSSVLTCLQLFFTYQRFNFATCALQLASRLVGRRGSSAFWTSKQAHYLRDLLSVSTRTLHSRSHHHGQSLSLLAAAVMNDFHSDRFIGTAVP